MKLFYSVKKISFALVAFVLGVSLAQAQGADENVRESHGDWKVLCQSVPEGMDPVCVMEQIALNADNEPLVNMRLRKLSNQTDKDGNPVPAVAQIIVPLNVFLPAGLGVKIDENEVRGAPYERCTSSGCVVRAPVSPEMLADMENGSTAQILMVIEPGSSVPATLSLSGFSAAMDAI